MTTEQKARAYDEAIERAKKMSMNGYLDTIDVEYIFPELNECDGERIRKTLLDHFKQNRDEGDYDERWNGLSYDSIITWLEKQGKSKSYSWKPSKEQFEALDYAYNSCSDTERGNYYKGVLETLIEDLRKFEKQGEQKEVDLEDIKNAFKAGYELGQARKVE